MNVKYKWGLICGVYKISGNCSGKVLFIKKGFDVWF